MKISPIDIIKIAIELNQESHPKLLPFRFSKDNSHIKKKKGGQLEGYG